MYDVIVALNMINSNDVLDHDFRVCDEKYGEYAFFDNYSYLNMVKSFKSYLNKVIYLLRFIIEL